MLRAQEALCIDLVKLLGARWSRSKPAVSAYHLNSTEGGSVSRRTIKNLRDLFTRQLGGPQLISRQPCQRFLLLRRGRCFDALGEGFAQVGRDVTVEGTRIFARARGNLRCQ